MPPRTTHHTENKPEQRIGRNYEFVCKLIWIWYKKKNDYVLCLFEYNMSYTREGVQIAVAQE